MSLGRPLHVMVPGPIGQATGGYGYLRRAVAGLRARGETVVVHELPGSYPVPDDTARTGADRALAQVPDAALVLTDGLALPMAANALWVERHRLRLVALVHHPLHLETGLTPVQAALLRQLERVALSKMRRVVVPSRATAADVVALDVPAGRIGIVPPGTDPAPPAQGSADGVPTLLTVATLTPRKGHGVLLEALASLATLPWRAVLAGSDDRDPAEAARLRATVARLGLGDRVTLTGEVTADRLEALWHGADLFVLPSFHEGYGMAAAEALARGLPVVASRAGALPELVPEAAGGLVPPGDAAALAAALRPLLADAQARARAAAAARAAGAALPDWPATAAALAAELAYALPQDRRIERIA